MQRKFYLADLGGTGCRFCRATADSVMDLKLAAEAPVEYPTKGLASFQEAVERFRQEQSDPTPPDAIGVGIAAPIRDGQVPALANLPAWALGWNEKALSAQLGYPAYFINDTQAAATGVRHRLLTQPNYFVPFTTETTIQSAPKQTMLLIAPGTGLGKTILHYVSGMGLVPMPTEGGHEMFNPGTDKLKLQLMEHLSEKARQRDPIGYVSWEMVLSGSGINDIYEFLLATSSSAQSDQVVAQSTLEDRPATIASRATTGDSSICLRTMTTYMGCLGKFAGNQALASLCPGGIIIGGGIVGKNLELFQMLRWSFLATYRSQGGPMYSIVHGTPAHLDPRYVETSLLGIAAYTAEQMSQAA